MIYHTAIAWEHRLQDMSVCDYWWASDCLEQCWLLDLFRPCQCPLYHG